MAAAAQGAGEFGDVSFIDPAFAVAGGPVGAGAVSAALADPCGITAGEKNVAIQPE